MLTDLLERIITWFIVHWFNITAEDLATIRNAGTTP